MRTLVKTVPPKDVVAVVKPIFRQDMANSTDYPGAIVLDHAPPGYTYEIVRGENNGMLYLILVETPG